MKNLLSSSLAFSLLLGACSADPEGPTLAADGATSIDVLMAAGLASELTPPETLTGASPDAAATDVLARATELAPCGTADRTGESVTLTFPSGCTLVTGQSVSGVLTVQLTSGDGGAAATLALDTLTVDGRTIDGTLAVAAATGSLTLALDLTTARGTVEGTLTVTSNASSVAVDGILALGPVTTLGFDGVTWETGACYPNGGAVSVSTGPATQTIVFDAASAGSGVVTVSQGSLIQTATLPGYGACPSAEGGS